MNIAGQIAKTDMIELPVQTCTISEFTNFSLCYSINNWSHTGGFRRLCTRIKRLLILFPEGLYCEDNNWADVPNLNTSERLHGYKISALNFHKLS